MNSHCVFLFLFLSVFPGTSPRCTVLCSSSEQHVKAAALTTLNSSGDRGQGRGPGLVFMVRRNVNSGWEKRVEVIMRHPPSAGCLFGQTGCLTAQAVDRILMDMTNDSLSLFLPIPSHSALSPLIPPSPPLFFLPPCWWNFPPSSQGSRMHNSFTSEGIAATCTHISEYLGRVTSAWWSALLLGGWAQHSAHSHRPFTDPGF